MGDLPLGGAYAHISGLHMYYEVHGTGALPGTTHVTAALRSDLLAPMILKFLDG